MMQLFTNKNTKHTSGFTIVELLVVIAVIGILAAISVVAYNGLQARGYDTSVLSDIDALDGLQSNYGIKNSTAGKAYYSTTTPTDSELGFTVSAGNVIDVVVDSADYCIRGYNPKGSRKSLSVAYTKESSSGACSRIAASTLAQNDSPIPVITDYSTGFESGADGWTVGHVQSTATIATNIKRTDVSSLKLVHNGTWDTGCSCGVPDGAVRKTITGLTVGQMYTYSVWVFTPDASGVTQVQWQPSSPWSAFGPLVVLTSNVWTKVTHSFTATATSQYIFINSGPTSPTTPAVRTIYLDDISVTRSL